jgi:hypothetical protein
LLAELRSQEDDIKEYVNNKISSLRQEIQGANISVSTEGKNSKVNVKLLGSRRGTKSSTTSTKFYHLGDR